MRSFSVDIFHKGIINQKSTLRLEGPHRKYYYEKNFGVDFPFNKLGRRGLYASHLRNSENGDTYRLVDVILSNNFSILLHTYVNSIRSRRYTHLKDTFLTSLVWFLREQS